MTGYSTSAMIMINAMHAPNCCSVTTQLLINSPHIPIVARPKVGYRGRDKFNWVTALNKHIIAKCDAIAVMITRIGNRPRPEFKHAYGIARVPDPIIVFGKLNVAVVKRDGTITN